jgi:hypothetical protein
MEPIAVESTAEQYSGNWGCVRRKEMLLIGKEEEMCRRVMKDAIEIVIYDVINNR